jgi:hypothetical protein
VIDTIKMTGVIRPPTGVWDGVEYPLEWNGLHFNPIYNKNNDATRYRTQLKNMQLTIAGDKLYIENSLQKYFTGNNYGDFTFQEVKESLQKLENELNVPLGNFQFTAIEYGVNILVDPNLVYLSWKGYKNKDFVPMINNGRTYGVKLFMSEYTLKGYNKTYEVKAHDRKNIGKDVFRIEVGVKRIRHLTKRANPININYVSDLKNENTLWELSNDLISKYKIIDIKAEIDFFKMTSIEDKKIMAAMENKAFREDIAKHNKIQFRRYNRRCKELKKRYGVDMGVSLEPLLQSKFSQLRDN